MRFDVCLSGHAVVCGFGHLGSRIAAQLKERGCDVVVVETDVNDAVRTKAQSIGCRLIEGDVRDESVMEKAGIASAACIIAVTGDDCTNLEASIEARERNAHASVVVRLFDQSLARRVEKAFDLQALSASFLASPAYVSAATDDAVAAVFNVDDCYVSIRHDGVCCKSKKKQAGVFVYKDGASIRVAADGSETPGECLLVTINKGEHHRILHKPRKAKTPVSRLPGLFLHLHPMRLIHEVAGVWRHSTAVTRSIMGALVFIGLLSIFIFSFFGKMRLSDALYLVVTAMTTTGFGDTRLPGPSPWLKFYGVFMMICGTALMATVYSIIADYVLTARMEYLMGRRQVSLREHTVVVGLGNVGYRVAHDLKMLGTELVAVESNDDSDNVSAARAMFPVIIGDASRATVLKKAGIDRAKVLLAVTDNPMLNLSVALHAKESNPAIKAVIRMYEINLADKLKNFIRAEVLSTSAIAAPAFVDAALYPGVQGSFKIGDEDVLVANHAVNGLSPLIGKSVEMIGSEIGVAVVLAAGGVKSDYHVVTPETILREGQRVIVLLTREKIGKLIIG